MRIVVAVQIISTLADTPRYANDHTKLKSMFGILTSSNSDEDRFQYKQIEKVTRRYRVAVLTRSV